jgi:predicted secreted acid phosphatase
MFYAPPPAPAPPAAIVAYHDSGEWSHDISTVTRRTKRVVRAHLHDPHSAIVLDVDDTSLSSYRCRKAVHFEHGKADCVGPGKMPAIRQTRSLYRYAVRHHVRVFFITGRRASVRATTIANLHRAGYAGRLRVKLRPVDEAPGSHDGWKARTRARIVKRGYRIVANVGDQRSDLDGGSALRTFKLPNPMYVIPTA